MESRSGPSRCRAGYLFRRVIHSFSVLPREGDHFICAGGGPANAQAPIAFGDQSTRDWMENFVEHCIAYSRRAGMFNERKRKPFAHDWQMTGTEKHERSVCHGRYVTRNELGIIVSVWLDPSVVSEKVDFKVLFETHRAATAKAIHKAMHHEPDIDWLLENQNTVTHCFHQMALDAVKPA